MMADSLTSNLMLRSAKRLIGRWSLPQQRRLLACVEGAFSVLRWAYLRVLSWVLTESAKDAKADPGAQISGLIAMPIGRAKGKSLR